MKYLLRYIAGTQDLGVFYSRQEKGDNRLIGYSDSDHTGHVDNRRITSGVLYCLDTNPITWQSCKQKVVALLSCEAEGGGHLVMRGRVHRHSGRRVKFQELRDRIGVVTIKLQHQD